MEVYNKNRDQNNSIHDEIKEQNAKLKNAPFKEKLEYFKDYYLKVAIVIIAAIVIVIGIAHSIITSPSDTAFAAYLFNSTGDTYDTELLDSFVEHEGIDTKKHYTYLDCSFRYAPEAADNYTYMSIEKCMAVISSKQLDVMIGDQSSFEYYASNECFYDITTVLPEDLMDKFKDKLVYCTVTETGETYPCGIYVDDAPKLNKYHYYDGVEPIMSFLANSQNIDTAIDFLRFIYMEE